jgi:general secretion pathway protein K
MFKIFKKLPNPLKTINNNNSGMAILLVLSFILMISFIAKELAFEARVEYEFSAVNYRELKAYHAARSAMEISLFRVMLYKQAKAVVGDKIPDPSMLDMIWSLPMAWPPALKEDASLIAKDDLEDVKEESLQDAEWTSVITPEGSKIDLNDLDSPSKALQKAVKNQIVQLIRNRLEEDDDWARDNDNIDPEEIVNHMIDYIDKDEESQTGGAESSFYRENNSERTLPPNRMFRTMDELLLIPGMDIVLYNHLAPNFTLYGIRAINVNHASTDVLMSIDPQITEEVAKDIKNQINDLEQGGPFKTEDEFKSYISKDVDVNNFNPDKIPLVFQAEATFNIDVTGSFKNTTRGIKAIVFDVDDVTKTLEKTLKEEALAESQQNQEGSGDGSGDSGGGSGDSGDSGEGQSADSGNNNQQTTPEQKKPNIVFWEEY